MSEFLLFVGSLNRPAPYFRSAHGTGLSVWRFNEKTLETEKLAETGDIDNPTYLSVSGDGSLIYANSEVFGWLEGTVTAYGFDRSTSALSYINKQPALGSITAHNVISRDGSKLLLANYAMGKGGPDQSVVVLGIREDGGLTAPLGWATHMGSGISPERQERPHAHSVTELAQSGMFVVADLGIDRLVTYRADGDGSLHRIAQTRMPSGAGPRHVALHRDGGFLFVINELDSSVASLSIDTRTGALTLLDIKPSVPDKARANNHCADIQISPDGRFLYGSNRGDDSIAIFSVDQQTGMLENAGLVPCGGETPRNLCLTPTGSHLLCANQDSDRISIFARHPETGLLADTGRTIEVGTPMCVKMVR